MAGDSLQSDQWFQSVESGLSQLGLQRSLKTVNAVVLPSWAVRTKLLRVARIEGEGQREVVRFEAEQATPRGLTGYEWSFQVLKEDGFERDVLLQAVDSDFLGRLMELLATHGARPAEIIGQVSAQIRAFEQQYGEESGASLVLDIGSRSVSLMVLAQGNLPFIRSFNFGGSLVTQTLAKNLGISLQEAEAAKLAWVGSFCDSGNQELLNRSSEGFLTRLVNEVQRSLALYRRQGLSDSPSRIFLSGGASQLPGLADILERKTGISCSFYDPFRSISSGLGLAASQTTKLSYALSAPLGLALGWSDLSSASANLLPSPRSSKARLSKDKPWVLVAVGLCLTSALIVGLKFHLRAWELQSEVARLEAELVPLESFSKKVTAAHEEYGSLSKGAVLKATMIQDQRYWVALLADLQGRLNQVQDVWLESISPEAGGDARASGRLRVTGSLLDRENPLSLVSSHSRGRVEVLLGSFENSPFVQSVVDRRFDTSRPGILQFDFSLVVNPEVVF